jgi:hypothetical protein
LITQRKNRKASKSGSNKKKVKGIVDRRMITPGCRFNGEVSDAVAYFVCQRLASFKYEKVKFYVSGTNVAGEGELKIMRYIKSLPSESQKSDTFALVGSDADLVLLAVAAQVPNITIFNAMSKVSSKGERREEMVEFNIDALMAEFSALIPGADPRHVGTDFVALSILSGNDYLPKMPHVGMGEQWKHYVKARNTPTWEKTYLIDTKTGRLNIQFFDFLLSHSRSKTMQAPPIHHERKLAKLRQLRADLAAGKLDREAIIAEYSSQQLTEDEEGEESLANEEEDDLDDDLDEEHEGVTQSHTTAKAAAKKAAPVPSPSKPQQHVQAPRDPIHVFLDVKSRDSWQEYDADDHASQYIYGVEWVVQSYLRGESLDYDWFFPYSSAPGAKQLCQWLAKAKTNPQLVRSLPVPIPISSSHTIPIQTSNPNSMPGVQEALSAATNEEPYGRPARTVPYQPWMFALMLLDSTTYDFVSPHIPTQTIADGSYVKEVHSTDFFFGFIDADRMEQELSQFDLSSMPKQDREYSMLGHMQMFERAYHNDGTTFVPRSPFPNQESRMRGLFRRHSIDDLVQHHMTLESNARRHGQRQDHQSDRYRSSEGPGQHGSNDQRHGNRNQHSNQHHGSQRGGYGGLGSQRDQGQNSRQGRHQGHQSDHHTQGNQQEHQGQRQEHNNQRQGNQRGQRSRHSEVNDSRGGRIQRDSPLHPATSSSGHTFSGGRGGAQARQYHRAAREDDATTSASAPAAHLAHSVPLAFPSSEPAHSASVGQKVELDSLFGGTKAGGTTVQHAPLPFPLLPASANLGAIPFPSMPFTTPEAHGTSSTPAWMNQPLHTMTSAPLTFPSAPMGNLAFPTSAPFSGMPPAAWTPSGPAFPQAPSNTHHL